MNDIVNSFMGKYFLTFLAIAVILFVINELIKNVLILIKTKGCMNPV